MSDNVLLFLPETVSGLCPEAEKWFGELSVSLGDRSW